MCFISTVNDMEFGRYLYRNKTADVLSLILKPTDTADVIAVKHIIARMMTNDPKERTPIGKVIETLSELLAASGDVWEIQASGSVYSNFTLSH